MSNNRLWIIDEVSGKRMLLAKGWCCAWEVFPESLDVIQNFFNEVYEDNYSEETDCGEDTNLKLITESDPRG